MKAITSKNISRLLVYTLLLAASIQNINAQIPDSTIVKLSLHYAIQYAKASNKSVIALKTEQEATSLDLTDAKLAALPHVTGNASYQRYSNVTLFDGVLGSSHQISKPPNANAGTLNAEASFNLYAGGRQQSLVTDRKRRTEMASLDVLEQETNIAFQVTLEYLNLVRLYFQRHVIQDQVTRARIRSKNINAFYANGKVTKSDVLRAEVVLSNVLLSEEANTNDYLISNQKLNTLLNFDDFTKIIPVDTSSLIRPDSTELQNLLNDLSGSYAILKIRKNIEIQENQTRLIRTFNLPSVGVFGGYGFNYPNTTVFPPVAQTVAVGLAGIKFTYEISSQYHNKYKVKSSIFRETKLREQKNWIEDNTRREAKSLVIKYNEAVNRIHVIQKSIQQAETNYNIQNTKYANQFSLLTDLLDADNLYQETRLDYIEANIEAISIYYQLLFITGNL